MTPDPAGPLFTNQSGEPMGTATETTATAITPATVPCTVAASDIAFDVVGVPGAAAAVKSLIIEYGYLSAQWKPCSDLPETPYAFVALGMWSHAVWFAPDKWVRPFERTACGVEFATACEPLLFDHRGPCVLGPCSTCLHVWRHHYDQL